MIILRNLTLEKLNFLFERLQFLSKLLFSNLVWLELIYKIISLGDQVIELDLFKSQLILVFFLNLSFDGIVITIWILIGQIIPELGYFWLEFCYNACFGFFFDFELDSSGNSLGHNFIFLLLLHFDVSSSPLESKNAHDWVEHEELANKTSNCQEIYIFIV